MATQAQRFWRRHRWTALRSLLLLALLHRLHCLPFLAASAPVLLLTAFLLGLVLVHSDGPPLAAEDEADRRHLYKKIRQRHVISSDDNESPSSSSASAGGASSMEEEEHLVAAASWTADDERSIRSIGSLELERDARLEKLMSRRSIQQSLIDLDVHIPQQQHCPDGDPGSAPSSLLRRHPFHEDTSTMLTRHESFTAPLARPSRFRPYFVADHHKAAMILEDNANASSSSYSHKKSSSSSPSSPSSSSSAASDHHKQQQQQQTLIKAQEEAAPPPCKWDGMAVDVELISDSSDDDMSLPGDAAAAAVNSMEVEAPERSDDDDEDDSFEVASITQQVAAAGHHHQQQLQMGDEDNPLPHANMAAGPAGYGSGPSPSGHQQEKEKDGAAWVAPSTLPPVEEHERREREVSEIREHHIFGTGPVAVVDDSSSSSPRAGAGSAGPAPGVVAAAAAGSSGGKSSSKSKASSKKVFGFFRK